MTHDYFVGLIISLVSSYRKYPNRRHSSISNREFRRNKVSTIIFFEAEKFPECSKMSTFEIINFMVLTFQAWWHVLNKNKKFI